MLGFLDRRRRPHREVGEKLARKRFLNQAVELTGVVSARIGPFEVLLSPSDSNIGRGLFVRGSRGQRHIETVLRRLDSGAAGRRGSFLDVGANIGTSTFNALAHRFDRAVCVEPEPRNAALLRATVALNGLGDRVTVVEAAAGEAPGWAELGLHATNSGGHEIDAAGNGVRVPVTTLDALVADGRITLDEIGLVWLDVQGYELRVLRGATRLLERGIPLVFEFSPRKLAARGDLAELCSLIEGHYSQLVDVRGDTPVGSLSELAEQAAARPYTDLLAYNP